MDEEATQEDQQPLVTSIKIEAEPPEESLVTSIVIEAQQITEEPAGTPEENQHPESERSEMEEQHVKPLSLADIVQIVKSEEDEPPEEPSIVNVIHTSKAEEQETEPSENVTVIRVSYEEESQPAVERTESSEKEQDEASIVEIGVAVQSVLPGIIDQMVNIENLLADEADASGEAAQTQEEERMKEREDALGSLMEPRETVAPTLGENTTGPPSDSLLNAERSLEHQLEELSTQWQEIQELLGQRGGDATAEASTQSSSVRYLATVTQVTVNETTEERVVKLNDNLAALQTAVRRREVVVIQRIVITIVRTVSEWLETIEYRICTVKQTNNIERRTELIQSLNEEVRIIEETLETLEEVTETAVEIVNEDTRLLIRKCVKSLKEQVKSISEVTKRSEDEIEGVKRQWSDYLDKINAEEALVADLILHFTDLQEADELPSEDRLVQLEHVETALEDHRQRVSDLLLSGRCLAKVSPFYEIPDSAFNLLNVVKSVQDALPDIRSRVLNRAALTAEYSQTLDEFAEIVRLSGTLTESKLVARTPEDASQELEKRQRFLFSLSHFLSLLDALEPHLDPGTRSLCQETHQSLVVKAREILEKSVGQQENAEMSLSLWEHLERQWAAEESWFHEMQLPELKDVSVEKFDQLIEAFQVIFSHCLSLISKSICLFSLKC